MSTRRDTLGLLTKSAVAVGTMGIGAGLLRSCTPSADVLAIDEQMKVTPPESGSLVFHMGNEVILIRRLSRLEQISVSELIRAEEEGVFVPYQAPIEDSLYTRYPVSENNADLFVISLKSPRGCVVIQDGGDYGDQGGFFCPCVADHFDGLGRFRKGYTRRNLRVPRFQILADGDLKIPALAQNHFANGLQL